MDIVSYEDARATLLPLRQIYTSDDLGPSILQSIGALAL
ncbi:hypothetical protein FHX64_000481 [Microbacter margulisiae]|uniref:Uncharacterized protein n=1 Tax=Microbacter margulisiae TaxID=1350067 RepID=A0A7W5H096_9PORP|nr:hypothetical protein [Microbacter margulisiae]